MADRHLNGAYYGPSIPPEKSYHRHGRGEGCDCCGCLCGCLFNLIFKIIFTIAVLIGLAIFVFWLVLRPNKVKFHVTAAELTQFNLSTTTNTLLYDLSLNLTIRNPNKHIAIYYDRFEARAFYGGQRFAATELPSFYQGRKTTTDLNLEFNGQNMVVLKNSELSDYNSDTSSGIYGIDVKLYLRVRFKLRGALKTNKFKPKIECDLKVPLDSNGNASGRFETTRCGLRW
ncbi:hypothetical protein U1Q18_014301 [Sarracenia purpurea var. burkii]